MDNPGDQKISTFSDMELDDRILKAIAKLGWLEPTPIQEATIPLMLQGKDVLIKARTGSGKTGAFAIPVIQKILSAKHVAREQAVRALILAPFRELSTQIYSNFIQLTSKCSKEVKCVNISPQLDVNAQKALLLDHPDIVVSTPTKALLHLKAGNLNVSNLEILIVDEADHVLSFGHDEDLRALLEYLPKVRQSALASATLSDSVSKLKKITLSRPAILKLEEPEVAPPTQLSHFHIGAEEEEKAVILYVLLKLNLVRGKTLIFVNTVDRCYKLKLYLEQFGIPSCVLNSELPAAVRCHSVSQFNQGLYDIIIASDELHLNDTFEQKKDDAPKKGKRKKDKESGVSRGIDFQFVSNVINFDFPVDVKAYIHRVGRTARGKNDGTALSLVSVRERPLLEQVEKYLCGNSESVIIKAYQFKMEEVDGFRYRSRDAWRAVTRIAVREARLKEIKQEIFNCDKLKTYFEDNPHDLASLRHDKALHTVKKQAHLTDVPDYIIPKSLKRLAGTSRRRPMTHGHQKLPQNKGSAQAKYDAKKRNPLLSMEFAGFNKRKK